MPNQSWLLIAATENESMMAKTTVPDRELLYRAASKWIIRGGVGDVILKEFWEYIDQEDNQIEDALLDQLITQAETEQEDPQTTTVKTTDYAIDMTVQSRTKSDSSIECEVNFVLYVYFGSVGKHIQMDKKDIQLTLINTPVETIDVTGVEKTPAPHTHSRRVVKRSSKKSLD